MGLSGEFWAGTGWLHFNDDIESRVGFQWNNQPANNYTDFDVDTQAFAWGGTTLVPFTRVREFPIYLDFGLHYLTAEDDEFNRLIRAQGSLNNNTIQYDTVIKTGNPWDNLNGQFVVPVSWGSDIRDARFDFDYSGIDRQSRLRQCDPHCGSRGRTGDLHAEAERPVRDGGVRFLLLGNHRAQPERSDPSAGFATMSTRSDGVQNSADRCLLRYGSSIRTGTVGLDLLGELRFIYNDSEVDAQNQNHGQ